MQARVSIARWCRTDLLVDFVPHLRPVADCALLSHPTPSSNGAGTRLLLRSTFPGAAMTDIAFRRQNGSAFPSPASTTPTRPRGGGLLKNVEDFQYLEMEAAFQA